MPDSQLTLAQLIAVLSVPRPKRLPLCMAFGAREMPIDGSPLCVAPLRETSADAINSNRPGYGSVELESACA